MVAALWSCPFQLLYNLCANLENVNAVSIWDLWRGESCMPHFLAQRSAILSLLIPIATITGHMLSTRGRASRGVHSRRKQQIFLRNVQTGCRIIRKRVVSFHYAVTFRSTHKLCIQWLIVPRGSGTFSNTVPSSANLLSRSMQSIYCNKKHSTKSIWMQICVT